MLSPYFQKTIMVSNTTQLGQILNDTKISTSPLENINGAVIINTCGECVPIPSSYATKGYDTAHSSYAFYCYILGQKVRLYNWTWASIVGWPFYYVSNTALFSGNQDQNGWGIFGMKMVSDYGLQAFLEGLDIQPYGYAHSQTSSPGVVHLSSQAQYYCNYYGIYPSATQTATRALSTSIITTFNLTVSTYIFNTVNNCNPGAVYRHGTSGGFLALGIDRPPDIRLTALGLLSYYQPRIFNSQYTASGTSRLVVLQLGQVGSV